MSTQDKSAIIIDTNLIISAIILKGNTTPNKLLTAWRQDHYTLLMSEELIAEIEAVLRREKIFKKYHILPEEIDALLEELRFSTQFVTSLSFHDLPIHSRDIKDDKLLACALTGVCNYLITGDNDLLVLNGDPALENLKIITATEFLSTSQ